MGKIRGIETPRINDASREPECPVYREVHKEGIIRPGEEESISETRQIILEKYKIPEKNTVQLPYGKEGRRIRAFTILQNIKNPEKSYYAEGHTSHANLLAIMLEQFSDEIGENERTELADDFFDNWATKKGFVDPYQNGFQSFPESRKSLLDTMKQHLDINGLNKEELHQLAEQKMPNWFLSGDSSKE